MRETLDGISYPVFIECDKNLKQGNETTTLRHYKEGKVACLELGETSALFPTQTFIVVTTEQQKEWWRTPFSPEQAFACDKRTTELICSNLL